MKTIELTDDRYQVLKRISTIMDKTPEDVVADMIDDLKPRLEIAEAKVESSFKIEN